MSFTTEKSTVNNKPITVKQDRVEESHNGHVVDVVLPAVVTFDGSKRVKRVNGKEIDMGLPFVKLFIEELPPQSINRLFEYGVSQYFADSLASANTPEDAQGRLAQRLDLLLSGQLTVRKANPVKKAASNPDYALIVKLFADQLRKATAKIFGGDKPVGKDKEAVTKWDAAQVEALKLLSQHPKVKKMVEEEKARLAALAESIQEEDILSGLFDDEDEDLAGEGEGEGEDEGEGDSDEGEGEADDVSTVQEETEKGS